MPSSKYRLNDKWKGLMTATVLIIACLALIRNQKTTSDPEDPKDRKQHKRDLQNLTARWESCDWNSLSWNSDNTADEEISPCQRAFTSGSWLQCMLNAASYAASKWTDPKSLTEYGWVPETMTTMNTRTQGLFEAFEALGVSSENAEWRKVTTWHKLTTQVDGRTYPSTKGKYQNYLNLKDGTLLAYWNFGPDTMVNRQADADRLSPDEVVPLKQWSDVTFLDLKRECNSDPACMKRIEHIFRVNVVNGATRSVLQAILEANAPEEKHFWPGVQLKMDDPRALAVLGTPNGNGIAWFLGQHKGELGHKIIDAVNVFRCRPVNESQQWCLYFHVVDKPDS